MRKSASLLCDEGGRPETILALVTDITDHRQMERALRDADRRKDARLATLAHELRDPLAPIRNAIFMLQRLDGNAAKDQARSLMSMVERQVNHLIHLVEDLLEVSRITRGKITLKKTPVDLTGIIHQAIDISNPLIQSGDHKISLSLSEQPLILDGDPVRLSQVFANLLNNAAKYTPHGGHIEVSSWNVGGRAVVSVRDDGIGISSEMLPGFSTSSPNRGMRSAASRAVSVLAWLSFAALSKRMGVTWKLIATARAREASLLSAFL